MVPSAPARVDLTPEERAAHLLGCLKSQLDSVINVARHCWPDGVKVDSPTLRVYGVRPDVFHWLHRAKALTLIDEQTERDGSTSRWGRVVIPREHGAPALRLGGAVVLGAGRARLRVLRQRPPHEPAARVGRGWAQELGRAEPVPGLRPGADAVIRIWLRTPAGRRVLLRVRRR